MSAARAIDWTVTASGTSFRRLVCDLDSDPAMAPTARSDSFPTAAVGNTRGDWSEAAV
ncbi:MAG: hypothetical protein ACKO45_05330 [Cyanobium sp.]